MKIFLESTKGVPAYKYEKKKGTVFFLPKSLLKKSCKTTLCDDLNHASWILDLKGNFFSPAYSTLKMRSFTWLAASRTFTAPGGRGRLTGQSTKNNIICRANGKEQRMENIKVNNFISLIQLI